MHMTAEPAQHDGTLAANDIHLVLQHSEAQRLHAVLRALLPALEDRETRTPRQRERRREARAALGHLLELLDQAAPLAGGRRVSDSLSPAARSDGD
jgi:hypothetical protein